jgi:hypothetical protein
MEALLNEIKKMSLKERYKYKNSLTELFEEKEFVYLDTDELGRISMLQWHYKEPYQNYLCNEHKVGLTYHGCYMCVCNINKTKNEDYKNADEDDKKNVQELITKSLFGC